MVISTKGLEIIKYKWHLKVIWFEQLLQGRSNSNHLMQCFHLNLLIIFASGVKSGVYV